LTFVYEHGEGPLAVEAGTGVKLNVSHVLEEEFLPFYRL